MRKLSLAIGAAFFAAVSLTLAGEQCCQLSGTVSKLLTSWKELAEADKTGCAEERAKLISEVEAVAKQCPIGSRMGDTIRFVKTSLEVALKDSEDCAKACPLAQQGAAAAPAEGTKESEIAKLMTARSGLLKNLQELASYGAAASPARSCDAAKKSGELASAEKGFCADKAAKLVAAVRGDACEKSAAATLIKEVAGLTCEEKAGKLAAAIRGEACAEKATALLVTAATEAGKACTKDAATVPVAASAEKGFCADKAAKLVAAVRGDACEKSAAATLIKEVAGLTCEEKAGKLAAAIRGEACAEKATALLVTAATEAAKGTAPAAAPAAAACAATCAKSGEACCQDLLAGAKSLKESWDKAGAEIASMCPTKRKELGATFAALQGRSKALALMPETLMALAGGLEALNAMNGKLEEFAKANPEMLKSIPEERQKAFLNQAALIRESHEILAKMKAAPGSCAAKAEAEKAD